MCFQLGAVTQGLPCKWWGRKQRFQSITPAAERKAGRKFRQKNKKEEGGSRNLETGRRVGGNFVKRTKNWEEGGSRNLETRCMGGRRGGGLMLQVMFEDFCSVARVTPCKVPQIKGQSACRGIKTVLSLISF